jgi:RHS repeat-associated protein
MAHAKGTDRPEVQTSQPARGHDATSKPRPENRALAAAVKKAPTVVWPTPGSSEASVGETAVSLKGQPLRLARPHGKGSAEAARAGGEGVAKVRVDVLSREQADAAHVDGVLLRLARTDGVPQDGKVQLTLDYSGFADAYGGGYGSRLTFMRFPQCVLTTPDEKKCATGQPVPTTNDTTSQTLSAVVDASGTPDASTMGTFSTASTLVDSGATVLAATSGSSGDQGDYTATSLQPSSQWSVSNSSGAFTWSYPMRIPPAPGGLVPSVGLNYNSQTVDGQTAATNNQGSWIGEGFGYEPGFIERRYKPCSQDGHDKVNGDECWAFDNATIQMAGGASGEIVKDDTTGEWRISNDSNYKVEKLTDTVNADNDHEYWKITDTHGTEYYFGLDRLPGWSAGKEETGSTWIAPVAGDDSGEPCYNASFDAAFCNQAWRWNLAYVKDVHGNAMSYFYGKETNYYSRNLHYDVDGAPYVRGGYLKRIDYGQRDSDVYTTPASARVVFDTGERCLGEAADCEPGDLTDDTANRWPDVPWDRNCKQDTHCEGQNSPTFWTRKELTGIRTQIRSGSSYTDVDTWKLDHVFTDNGDGSKSLWLNGITNTGHVGGTAAMPGIELQGSQLPNRLDVAGDNIQAMNRYRLSNVVNESGGVLSVVYKGADCSADALPAEGESTRRCYPVKWNPPGMDDPITDWFHKYVVDHVTETDLVGGTPDMSTYYDYLGDAGWRKRDPDGLSDPKYLTWNDWRGYGRVRVTRLPSGVFDATSLRTEHVFYRGMDGNPAPGGGTTPAAVTDSTGTAHTDSNQLSGQELEVLTYDGAYDADHLVSKSITTPWSTATASRTRTVDGKQYTTKAYYVRSGDAATYTALEGYTAASPKWQITKSSTRYDAATGRATQVDDFGSAADPDDDRCTRTTYADNPTEHIYELTAAVQTSATDCADTGNLDKLTISDNRAAYDGGAVGDAPTKGDTTRTERLAGVDGSTLTFETLTDLAPADFDAYGRPVKVKDAAGSATTIAYTETNGLTTKKTETNPLGWVTATEYAPAWGVPAAQVDANGHRTDLGYDPLGRLTGVWFQDRPKASFTPSIKYGYLTRTDAPTAVKTEKIQNDGTYGVPEYTLYDGQLRPVQVQTGGPDGGRMIADTFYDGAGQVVKANADYYTTGAPSDQRFEVRDGDVDAQQVTEFDGAGRRTADISRIAGDETWRTTYAYGGDRVHTDPPDGEAPTTIISDARGNTTEIRRYKGDAPVPVGPATGYESTFYTYTPAGQLHSVKDAAGNEWSYTYDAQGREATANDPDTGSTSFTYDVLDRQTSVTDARGRKTSTVYDTIGRVTTTWDGDPLIGVKLTQHVYDTRAKGQLYGDYAFHGGKAYASVLYDQLDGDYQPLTVKYNISKTAEPDLGGTYTYTYTYNNDGTPKSSTVPAAGSLPAESLFTEYDDLQRPTSLSGAYGGTFADITYVNAARYSPTSQLQQLELTTGGSGDKKTWLTYAYERGTDRMTRSQANVEGATGFAYDARYTYDQVGDVTSISDQPAGGTADTQCFQFDWQRAMTQAWTASAAADQALGTGPANAACAGGPGAGSVGGPEPYWTSYGFDDATGNRTSEVQHGIGGAPDITSAYRYDDADFDGTSGESGDGGPHLLSTVTTDTPATGQTPAVHSLDQYSYDAAGNTTTRLVGGNSQTLEWDGQGHPVAVATGGTDTSYIYDSSGARLVSESAGKKTLYLPGMEVSVSSGTQTASATRYYTFGGETVAVRTDDGGVTFLASDHHGTAEVAVDAATAEVTRRRTDPYGNDRNAAPASWVTDKGFLGGTKDATTGLIHLGARDYDPSTGRFISADPVIDYTDPQQINGYSYSGNNPVSMSDPSGMRFCSDDRCGPGADYVDQSGYHEVPGDNDGCGGCSHKTEAQTDADKAKGKADSAKHTVAAVAEELAKIVMDELGITDALDCFTTGNLASCGSTLLNVGLSFFGGILGKAAKKYGAPWNWGKAYKLVKRIKGLIGKLIGSVKAWISESKAAKRLQGLADKTLCKVTNSFTPETRVLLADGTTKPIKDIRDGDQVLSTDENTDTTEPETVTAQITGTGTKHLVKITLTTDPPAALTTSSVTATDGHPFWVPALHEWINATDLHAGQWLRTAAGTHVQITAVTRWTQQATVHNLTVSDLHTYYVLAGQTPVLVHNSGCPSDVEGLQAAADAAGHFEYPGGMTGSLHMEGWDGGIPLSSGARNLSPSYLENLPPGTNSVNYHHLEAQAAGAMRAQVGRTGSPVKAKLFITGDYGACGACADRLATMLPAGSTLTVVWRDASGAIRNMPYTGVAGP